MQALRLLFFVALVALAGCATRPVNPPVDKTSTSTINILQSQDQLAVQAESLVILAFSGGGTRAAAFSYGVLEALKAAEVKLPDGRTARLLDQVDVITGVSGGSFTALAYRLYGDKLFDEYEKRFLKRDVQGALIGRALNPFYWPALASPGWGRSELAADYYDEILFNGATFADLAKSKGPLIAVSATDITSGGRVVFVPPNFDVLCAQLAPFRLARAAAASSAVPVVLSPLTIDNYGSTCDYKEPAWTKLFTDTDNPPRPAARALERLHELERMGNGSERYLHLVDGGVSDNLGLRGVLDIFTTFEALHDAGLPTPLDTVKRIVVFVVNSQPAPDLDWATKADAPGTVAVLLQATGVPIDRYSGEQIDQLKDIAARWKAFRDVRDEATFADPNSKAALLVKRAPAADIYVVDVSFAAVRDPKERDYLNQLPTSFVLTDEQVDHLRAAAGTVLRESPELKRVLKDTGARLVVSPIPPQ